MFVKKNKLKISDNKGFKYNVFSDKWELSNDTDVNYISKFEKI